MLNIHQFAYWDFSIYIVVAIPLMALVCLFFQINEQDWFMCFASIEYIIIFDINIPWLSGAELAWLDQNRLFKIINKHLLKWFLRKFTLLQYTVYLNSSIKLHIPHTPIYYLGIWAITNHFLLLLYNMWFHQSKRLIFKIPKNSSSLQLDYFI